jgi:hypothetical protein
MMVKEKSLRWTGHVAGKQQAEEFKYIGLGLQTIFEKPLRK